MIEPAAAAWTTESTWPQIVLLENPSEGRSSQAGPGAAALVTEVLREWANNTRTNHGLVICQVDESARSIEVPSLCITYVSGSRH
ncbi:MAG: hypothetical protein HKN21_07200 [Candidatus Eisenbacteria bacterium]|uniref:Uncharacterized protein n=1 Tax=Eiseniibacteriota bacterium TaxID=2212470 RepID=A0A7Y2H214_UNCEI|nr:hypothetical protein [Candidatus Eisenbacteria bacterium]